MGTPIANPRHILALYLGVWSSNGPKTYDLPTEKSWTKSPKNSFSFFTDAPIGLQYDQLCCYSRGRSRPGLEPSASPKSGLDRRRRVRVRVRVSRTRTRHPRARVEPESSTLYLPVLSDFTYMYVVSTLCTYCRT